MDTNENREWTRIQTNRRWTQIYADGLGDWRVTWQIDAAQSDFDLECERRISHFRVHPRYEIFATKNYLRKSASMCGSSVFVSIRGLHSCPFAVTFPTLDAADTAPPNIQCRLELSEPRALSPLHPNGAV
jgi:hypothetical protein